MEEEVGVAVLELLGDLESLPGSVVDEERGDAVPELLASFFLEDLPLSLALDNCSCYSINISESKALDKVGDQTPETVETYHSLPEAFHLAELVAVLMLSCSAAHQYARSD